MIPLRAIAICLLLICTAGTAFAGRGGTLEIVDQQGFLLLEDFQHWVGANYQYSGHSSNGGSSFASHRIEEVYHAQGNVAILSPHFIAIALGGDAGFDQSFSKSGNAGSLSSNSGRYQYNLDVEALDRSWHPIEIFSSRSLNTVVNPFSPALNTDISRSGISALFLKDPLRLRLKYETNTQKISGGGNDTTSVSDAFQASLAHTYGSLNVLSLDFGLHGTQNDSNGLSQRGYGNNMSLVDTLYSTGHRYSLMSELRRDLISTSGLPQTTLTWNETAVGHLGKVLEAELDNNYTDNKTTLVQGAAQDYQTETITGQLRHSLFASLTTSLGATYSEFKLPGGDESKYSGRVGLNYHKILPAASTLRVNLLGEHEVADRRGVAAELKVVNEARTVTQPFEVIIPRQSGTLKPGSVLVQGFLIAPANPQALPDTVFTQGVDYTVDLVTGRITWGAVVPPVPQIVLSYTVLLNTSEKYSTDSLNLSSSIDLFQGRYQISGAYSQQNRTLISRTTQSGLIDSRFASIRGQKFTETQTYSLEYSNYAAGPSKFQYVEAGWQYTPQTVDFSFQAQARDRYTVFEASDALPAHTDNTLNLVASGSRTFFEKVLFLMSLNVIDERGERLVATDSIFLRSTLRGRFNKLAVSFTGSTGWRFAGNSQTRDDNARIEIQRYF